MLDEDVAAVMAIEEQVYPHGWTEGIFRDCLRVHYSCWVMEQDRVLIAYGIMSVAVGEAHVLNVAVDPVCQGQGRGREMLTAFLEVRPSNVVAIRLYETAGFHQVGLRQDYYPSNDGREDAVIMARDLSDIDL
jgi:ribosomal-protein-alanine N-acetyltransferase